MTVTDIACRKRISTPTARQAKVEARFWAKVNKTDACWLWTASKSHDGYPKFVPTAGHYVYAHRFAYELLTGPIPDGLQLDHTCRVRHCVNPAHLEPVTNRENHLRIPVELRRWSHCKRGHEMTVANRVGGHGQCKTCVNERKRRANAEAGR